jgi:hypothetical protein
VGFKDDFWTGSNSVFINDFIVRSSLGELKISASAVELGSDDDFYIGNESFFVNDF